MKLDPTASYRTRITPWHDSDPACWILVLFSSVVFFFSLIGIDAASGSPEYRACLWMPLILGGLALFILINVLVRMANRSRSD